LATGPGAGSEFPGRAGSWVPARAPDLVSPSVRLEIQCLDRQAQPIEHIWTTEQLALGKVAFLEDLHRSEGCVFNPLLMSRYCIALFAQHCAGEISLGETYECFKHQSASPQAHSPEAGSAVSKGLCGTRESQAWPAVRLIFGTGVPNASISAPARKRTCACGLSNPRPNGPAVV